MKYFIDNSTWVEITPAPKGSGFGYGGLDVDLQRPGTVMVSALNQWWPDAKCAISFLLRLISTSDCGQ
jgi:xyloglucan-specific exo-beta-1,4-glucanase